MKRICRQHGISRWPSRKINKVNRSLSKLKRVIESVQGTDGTLDLTSLSTTSLSVAVRSSWPPGINGSSLQNSPVSVPLDHLRQKDNSANGNAYGDSGQAMKENHFLGEKTLNGEISHERDVMLPGLVKGSNSSREESVGTPTSHGSCQGSPANENLLAREPLGGTKYDESVKLSGSLEFPYQPPPAYSVPCGAERMETESSGKILLEKSGSSKDLKILCASASDAMLDDRVPELSWTDPPSSELTPKETFDTLVPTLPHSEAGQKSKSLTIKATYKDDIIRFRIPTDSGIVQLKEEIAKRFKLEVGTFDVKYLDDDHEWVLIACDADLQECIDLSRSAGSRAVRLLVHETSSNLGSSCESNGE